MDNVNFVKLPSEVLPTVTGNEVVIAETAAGKLYWCDSNGAKQLVGLDAIIEQLEKQYPIGIHVEQKVGEPTPAERFGFTWEIDKEYAGKTIVGSGNSYTLGATGGAENVTLTISQIPSHVHKLSYSSESGGWASVRTGTSTIETETEQGMSSVGGSQSHNNMPPYKVSNIWKRVA